MTARSATTAVKPEAPLLSSWCVRLGAGVLLAVLRWLPRGLFEPLGRALAWGLRLVSRRDRLYLGRNVAAVYGLPPGTHFAQMFERQVFAHQVVCALETLRLIQQPELVQVTGFDDLKAHVAAAEAAGRGHIIVTAHLGSWELCAYFGRKAASLPFHVLAKPTKHPAMTLFLDRLRARMGVDVFWTDRRSLLRDMLGALKKGESVGFVMDQKPEGRKGPVVDFLGIPTEFVSGPATVARTGSAVIALYCVREGAFRYRLLVETLLAPATPRPADDALTQAMASSIERAVRLYPEQWAWTYKRWRFVDGKVASAPVRTAAPASGAL